MGPQSTCILKHFWVYQEILLQENLKKSVKECAFLRTVRMCMFPPGKLHFCFTVCKRVYIALIHTAYVPLFWTSKEHNPDKNKKFCLRSFSWRPRFSTPEILLYFSLQHPLHTWMVTHPSANHGPSCLISVILRELVFPTWYCRILNMFF